MASLSPLFFSLLSFSLSFYFLPLSLSRTEFVIQLSHNGRAGASADERRGREGEKEGSKRAEKGAEKGEKERRERKDEGKTCESEKNNKISLEER